MTESLESNRVMEKSSEIKCPVYGYALVAHLKILIDQGKHRCPLSSGLDCQMEAKDDAADWQKCVLRIEKESGKEASFEQIKNSRVFPMRYRDKEYYKGWKGLPFEVWKNNILEGKEIPEEYLK